MTEDREQQELMDMIERLLAGETVEAMGVRGEEQARLLQLAAELGASRPEPDAGFQRQLEERLAAMKAHVQEAEATAAEPLESRDPETTGEPVVGPTTEKSAGGRQWLPGWLTAPRVAAVAASLVLGLGVIGLAGAVIRGGYRTGPAADLNAVSDTSTAASEAQTMEKATGVAAPERAGEIAADDAAGYAAGASATGEPGTSGTSGSASATLPPASSGQKVIQTADYQIGVARGEFDGRYSQLTTIASKYGGYVVSADSRSGGEDLKRGSITIRIANVNDNFVKAQAEIDGLGEIQSKKISGQDVTEEYVDLQSRLRGAQAEEAQMLELLKKAQTVDEILMVQSRLAEIQSNIEQIKGRIQYVESRTDFATISVDLRETDDGDIQTDDGSGIDWGFVESLRYAGWLAVQTVNFVIVALGVIVPVTLLALGLFLVGRWIVHRRLG